MTITISAGIAGNLSSRARPRAISRWLLAIAALVFLMVAIGGITRLTESGLSMVRWEPVSGVVPPLNDAEWQAERSEEPTSELQSLMRHSYAVFCLKKKTKSTNNTHNSTPSIKNHIHT